jgi:hypothetical protein
MALGAATVPENDAPGGGAYLFTVLHAIFVLNGHGPGLTQK